VLVIFEYLLSYKHTSKFQISNLIFVLRYNFFIWNHKFDYWIHLICLSTQWQLFINEKSILNLKIKVWAASPGISIRPNGESINPEIQSNIKKKSLNWFNQYIRRSTMSYILYVCIYYMYKDLPLQIKYMYTV